MASSFLIIYVVAKSHDRIKGVAVNPVDTKVRNGTYDDYPGKA